MADQVQAAVRPQRMNDSRPRSHFISALEALLAAEVAKNLTRHPVEVIETQITEALASR